VSEYRKPLPRIDHVSAPYWEHCLRHELRLQQCNACGTMRYPPKEICPSCLSADATWERISGRGTVWSWVEMHQQYFAGFREELPYIVLFVKLQEGPMMMTNLVDSDRDALRCEAPVEVTFVDATDEISLPQFRLSKGRERP
jgi:uncharacterized OB-fold protein